MTKINQEEYKVLKKLDDKWKWIARDDNFGGSIFCFREKPHKDIKGGEWGPDTTQYKWLGKCEILFQFIQWEDEEPYNIQELIDEYLDDEYGYFNMKLSREFEEFIKKESEETELKDSEWLKKEIHKELEDWHGVEGGIDGDGINEIMLLINQHEESEVKRLEKKIKELDSYNDELVRDNNQFRNELDNQEVLSEEWIDEHAWNNDHIWRPFVFVDDLKEVLVPKQEEITEEQVSEYLRERSMTAVDSTLVHRENLDSKIVTEIPSIPEFVAEFLDGKEDYMLHELFDDEWLYSKHDQIAKWLYDNDEETNRERELSLVLAHIYGYEVETEQRYYVVNNDQRMMLVRMMDGKTITEADPFKLEDMYEAEKKAHRLTEKEIKDYDPRYWAFRKLVEELEG